MPAHAPFHLVIRNPRAVGEKVAGSLHRVTEPNHREVGCASSGRTEHSHGIRVIQHNRLRAEALGIAEHIEPNGNRPKALEKPACPDGVANTLVNAIPGGNVVVVPHALEAADLDTIHNVVRPLEHRAAVRRSADLPSLRADPSDELSNDTLHGVETLAVDINKGDLATAIAGCEKKIVHKTRSESTARAKHGDLDRALHGSLESCGSGALGVGLMTLGGGFAGGFFHL